MTLDEIKAMPLVTNEQIINFREAVIKEIVARDLVKSDFELLKVQAEHSDKLCCAEIDLLTVQVNALKIEASLVRKLKTQVTKLIEAGNCINHWHDSGKDNEGMVVSAEHVRQLWAACAEAQSVIDSWADESTQNSTKLEQETLCA